MNQNYFLERNKSQVDQLDSDVRLSSIWRDSSRGLHCFHMCEDGKDGHRLIAFGCARKVYLGIRNVIGVSCPAV